MKMEVCIDSGIVHFMLLTHFSFHFAGRVMVDEEIDFELNSELTAVDAQFTLTCISTGGPATTVTWTRDSEEAPGQRRSVLDNATTAQYTHILTVTGRLGGLYTCTVSNSIPSKDTANQTLEGKHIIVMSETVGTWSLASLPDSTPMHVLTI